MEAFYIGTPEVMPTYIIYLCLKTFKSKGGVEFYEDESKRKSKLIYDEIDGDFYKNDINEACRSRTVITFWIKDDEILEKKFIEEAKAENPIGLNPFAVYPGIWACAYNSMPIKGVEKLVLFMWKFKQENN